MREDAFQEWQKAKGLPVTDQVQTEGGSAEVLRSRPEVYRDFEIRHDPPPIPVRSMDWEAVHKDYDGPGDTYYDTDHWVTLDNRVFRAGSRDDLIEEIDLYWEEETT